MASRRLSGVWTVWLLLIVGVMLSLIPLPDSVVIFRPMWVALFLAYWLLSLPHKVGMLTAWVLGILLDVLQGTLLGQNALALTLIAFLLMTLQQRMRMFPLWQQSMVLLVVFGLSQLVLLWLHALTGSRVSTLTFLMPALTSAALWPLVSFILHKIQRRLNLD